MGPWVPWHGAHGSHGAHGFHGLGPMGAMDPIRRPEADLGEAGEAGGRLIGGVWEGGAPSGKTYPSVTLTRHIFASELHFQSFVSEFVSDICFRASFPELRFRASFQSFVSQLRFRASFQSFVSELRFQRGARGTGLVGWGNPRPRAEGTRPVPPQPLTLKLLSKNPSRQSLVRE